MLTAEDGVNADTASLRQKKLAGGNHAKSFKTELRLDYSFHG